MSAIKVGNIIKKEYIMEDGTRKWFFADVEEINHKHRDVNYIKVRWTPDIDGSDREASSWLKQDLNKYPDTYELVDDDGKRTAVDYEAAENLADFAEKTQRMQARINFLATLIATQPPMGRRSNLPRRKSRRRIKQYKTRRKHKRGRGGTPG